MASDDAERDSAGMRHPIRGKIFALKTAGEDVAGMSTRELRSILGGRAAAATVDYHRRVLADRGLID